MSDSPDTLARIQELEIKAMEQQRLLADLSEVLYAQQRQLDELGQRVHRLGQKLAAEPGLVDANQDDKPPHY
jgi:SlyX protein